MVQYIISPSELKCASEYLRRNKQKMSGGKKIIEEKQNYFIGKYATSQVRFYNVGFKIFKNFKTLKYFIM